MSNYQVTIKQFEGPLGVLLSLIEKKELDVSSLSLGAITEDFLKHIERVEQVAPHDVADFLIVAARLLYLKSKLLLPELTIEEEEGIDLADQLRMYQRFAQAAERIADLLVTQRTAYLAPRQTIEVEGFYPPSEVTPDMLKSTMESVVTKLEPYVSLPEKLLERTVSVEEKIEHLKDRIKREATTYFHDLSTRGSRADVVTSFLALLELLKQDIVRVEQSGLFEDIAISRV